MSFTVVPLHNLDLPAGTIIPFGTKFVLQDVPGLPFQVLHHQKVETVLLADVVQRAYMRIVQGWKRRVPRARNVGGIQRWRQDG
jgi:hypothetical protein